MPAVSGIPHERSILLSTMFNVYFAFTAFIVESEDSVLVSDGLLLLHAAAIIIAHTIKSFLIFFNNLFLQLLQVNK